MESESQLPRRVAKCVETILGATGTVVEIAVAWGAIRSALELLSPFKFTREIGTESDELAEEAPLENVQPELTTISPDNKNIELEIDLSIELNLIARIKRPLHIYFNLKHLGE